MLNIIAALPKDKQAKFKDAVLSAFDHRKQPKNTIGIAQKLAAAHGFEAELESVINHDPLTDTENCLLYADTAHRIIAYIISDQTPDFDTTHLPNNTTVYFTHKNVDLSKQSFYHISSIKFGKESSVTFRYRSYLPEELDFSDCQRVYMYKTDLNGVKTIRFKENGSVHLSECTNIPADLDVSMCKGIYFDFLDFKILKNHFFPNCEILQLSECKNIPDDIDFYKPYYITLRGIDLSVLKNTTFDNCRHLSLSDCPNLPPYLDLSRCDLIGLSDMDLAPIKTVNFKEDSYIDIISCKNLPQKLDFSKCKKVWLKSTDTTGVKSISFKNSAQQEQSNINLPADYQGKIIYTDDFFASEHDNTDTNLFVAITNPVNALRVENIIRPYKKGEKAFTSKVARDILSMTNHPKNIRDILNIIAALPKDEQAPFQNIVLAAFTQREQPADTVILGKKLAITNGYEKELNNTLNNDLPNAEDGSYFYASATNRIIACISTDKKPNISDFPTGTTIYFIADTVELHDQDFADIKEINFKKGSSVLMTHCQNLPKDTDFTMCHNISIKNTNLKAIRNWNFRGCRSVALSHCGNIPKALDFSMCDEVNLSHTDISDTDIKFKKDAVVDLSCATLPQKLDVSMCSKINLHDVEIKPDPLPPAIIFRDKQQLKQSGFVKPKDWQGTIYFSAPPTGISRLKSFFERKRQQSEL